MAHGQILEADTLGWKFLDIWIVTHPTQGTLREWSLDYTSINSLAARPDSCAAGKCLQRQRYMWVMEQSLNIRREKGRFCFDSHDPLFSPYEWFTRHYRNKSKSGLTDHDFSWNLRDGACGWLTSVNLICLLVKLDLLWAEQNMHSKHFLQTN